MCDPDAKVSAHYLIDEDGRLYGLVDEDRRAWHAGVASWHGETDINGCSIGIELVNPGHEFGYRAFPEPQMHTLEQLCRDVMERHDISAARVLGHADVAPGRKQDPGELFDWPRLAKQGLAVWPDPHPVGSDTLREGDANDDVLALQADLGAVGYGIVADGRYGPATAAVDHGVSAPLPSGPGRWRGRSRDPRRCWPGSSPSLLTCERGGVGYAAPGGRMTAVGLSGPVEESPGSTGKRCRVTPGGGDPRESVTESKPPGLRHG